MAYTLIGMGRWDRQQIAQRRKCSFLFHHSSSKLGDNHQDNNEKFNGNHLFYFYAEKSKAKGNDLFGEIVNVYIESIKLDVGKSNSSEMSANGGSWESPILTKLGDNRQDNHEKFNGNDLFYAEKSKGNYCKADRERARKRGSQIYEQLLYACSALHYTLNFFITIILA